MKKTILTLSTVALLIMGGVIAGCNDSNENKQHNEHEHHSETVYQCPMKCEGDKTYDEAGSCPVCGMDMKKVESKHEHSEGHAH